jgi:DNA-directed RNA polymerase
MTFGYGSRQFGFREQIQHDTLIPANRLHRRNDPSVPVWPFEGDGFNASVFMAGLIQKAVTKTVVKAAEGMDWLRGMAKAVAKEDLPIHWTVPDGFPVLQAYRELKSRRITTFMAGSTIRIDTTVAEDGPSVDRRAQEQGIAPNFIHSLDGCHLRMTVVRAAEEGLSSFALVHDSFGTHAGETGRFFMLIREVLVEMYANHDVIENFREEIEMQISEEKREDLPTPPARGNLDLDQVVESDFCFA